MSRLNTLLYALFATLFTVAHWNVRHDDAYIFYVYARNIAEHGEWVFNRGEWVNACTSTLYPLLLALGYKLVPLIDIPSWGHVITGVSLFTLLVMTHKLLAREKSRYVVLGSIVFLAHPVVYSAVGMDVLLMLALGVSTIYYRTLRPVWSAFLLSLAVLARPDAMLLAVIVGVYSWRHGRWHSYAVFALPLLAWGVYAWQMFGTVIPNTVGMKIVQQTTGYWGTGWIFAQGIPIVVFSAWWALLLCIPLAIAVFKLHVAPVTLRILILWLLTHTLAYCVLNPPAYHWYYVPVVFALSLCFPIAFQRISKPLAMACSMAFFAMCCMMWVKTYASGETGKFIQYRALASYLNDHAEQGDDVAITEIGVLRYYYTQGRVIDPLSLVHNEGLPYLVAHEFGWFVSVFHPRYVVVKPRWLLEEYVNEAWFQRMYPTRVLLPSGLWVYQRYP